MQAIEWKAGQVVIETDLFTPALIVVAGVALSAETALVNIVAFVANEAVTHRGILFHTASVAGRARGLGMRAT